MSDRKIHFEMEVGEDLLREKQGPLLIAEIAKRRLEEFKLREGLDVNANESGDQETD